LAEVSPVIRHRLEAFSCRGNKQSRHWSVIKRCNRDLRHPGNLHFLSLRSKPLTIFRHDESISAPSTGGSARKPASPLNNICCAEMQLRRHSYGTIQAQGVNGFA
jgi:hypothetical protein